jgi:beta-glucanase (GH16 family)
MEHVGFDPNRVHFTLHCNKYNSGTYPNPRSRSINCYNVNTQFHVYAVEWNEDRIEFFVDGTLQFRVLKKTTDTWTEWPFHRPFYLILNSAFGGGWGGQQGINLAGLPQDYVIDYVRVFQ